MIIYGKHDYPIQIFEIDKTPNDFNKIFTQIGIKCTNNPFGLNSKWRKNNVCAENGMVQTGNWKFIDNNICRIVCWKYTGCTPCPALTHSRAQIVCCIIRVNSFGEFHSERYFDFIILLAPFAFEWIYALYS